MTDRRTSDEIEAATIAIVDAIADHRGVDAADFEWSLYEYLDPGALELLTESTTVWELTAEIDGDTVTVTSDGRLTVDDTLVTETLFETDAE